MTRRLITAEDVRRAQGGELIVDEDTVVTPQALEIAEAAGVVVRTAAGQPYAEPPPDRGPDAGRVATHLPEPSSSGGEWGVVVTAVGRNRPGVLAEITSALGEAGADVANISQRTIDDYFHLVLTVRLTQGGANFATLKQRMTNLGGADDYVVRIMHERVFGFMHRI